ncbi:hypothetical protein FOH38_01110 [Lysinibacillus fusiformis]|nr:hypothetical protein FOH38_01110 [Lysinibacillus fusiformis]
MRPMKVAPRLFRPFVMERPFYMHSQMFFVVEAKRQPQKTATCIGGEMKLKSQADVTDFEGNQGRMIV